MAAIGVRFRRINSGLPSPVPPYGPGVILFARNQKRVGLIVKNKGVGTVWLTDSPNDPSLAFPLETNEVINFLPNTAPSEPIYAWADANYDLRVIESIGDVTPLDVPKY